ncbi:hypothetical protein, partial [Escherichia coli]|uniref:hypothetical protein n=1 Tax=Escherichia coli TaxID=562 RepID=UPI00207BC40C
MRKGAVGNVGVGIADGIGSTERINLDKIHRVLDWAAEGLHNVSISQVELRSHIQFYDGI